MLGKCEVSETSHKGTGRVFHVAGWSIGAETGDKMADPVVTDSQWGPGRGCCMGGKAAPIGECEDQNF